MICRQILLLDLNPQIKNLLEFWLQFTLFFVRRLPTYVIFYNCTFVRRVMRYYHHVCGTFNIYGLNLNPRRDIINVFVILLLFVVLIFTPEVETDITR